MITSFNADKAHLPFISIDTPINKYRLTMYKILSHRDTFNGFFHIHVPVFDCEEVVVSYPDIITKDARRLLSALPPEMYEHIISYLDVGTQILALRRRVDLGTSYVYIHNREHVYIVTKNISSVKTYETDGNTTTMTVGSGVIATLGKLSTINWLRLYGIDFGNVGFTPRKWYRLMLDEMGFSDKRLDGPDEKIYAPRSTFTARLRNPAATALNKVTKFGNVGDTQYFVVDKDTWAVVNNLIRETRGLRMKADGTKYVATDAHRKHDAHYRRGDRRDHQPHVHRPTHCNPHRRR